MSLLSPAASGAAAEVPVCDLVQEPCRSVVAIFLFTFLSPFRPLLNVTARVDGQGSAYHGDFP